MNCYMCGKGVFMVLFDYITPDKYEKWVGLNKISRQWGLCVKCGFVQSFRNYPLGDLEAIYKAGYRHPVFRGESMATTYHRIMVLKYEESENDQRCDWVRSHVEPCKILDIGSGLGVFPVKMDYFGFDVECVEENVDSIAFIRGLGHECYNKIPKKKYDMVSLIHVVEHIEDPIPFLRGIKSNVGTWLFVEVPDAKEFKYLSKNHDEFNSCHVKFYTKDTLTTIIERSGFKVTHITEKYYKERGLSRVLALCQ